MRLRLLAPVLILSSPGCGKPPDAATGPASAAPVATVLHGRIVAVRPLPAAMPGAPSLLLAGTAGPADTTGRVEFIVRVGGRTLSVVGPNPDALAAGQAADVIRSDRTRIARPG